MENLIGLFTDGVEVNAPYGSWAYAKNILVNQNFKSISNEFGFSVETTTPYPTVGVIPTNKGYVLFTTNNAGKNSIYYIDETGTKNNVVVDNTTLDFRFDKPIEGVFKFNNLGELIVAWTDNYNEPRIMNVTAILAAGSFPAVNTIALFPNNYNSYLLETLVDSGGSLLAGAYQFTTKKITAYGTETQWELARQPIYVNDDADSLGHNNVDGAEGGTITNKSIQLNVTHNGSTEFSKIKIGILVTINGISNFYLYNTYNIDSGVDFQVSVTDISNLEELDIDELLINKAVYDTAKTIEVLNEEMYLGNITGSGRIDYQKYANNIKIGWTIRLRDITVLTLAGSSKKQEGNHDYKSFMPREVYNFYIFFYLKKGGLSEFYHIPGRELDVADRVETTAFADANTGFTTGVDKPLLYEVEDTCTVITYSGGGGGTGFGNGLMGKFENKNQTYSTGIDSEIWNAGGQIGSSTLAGEKVRFHKFPSSRFIHDLVLDSEYGTKKKEVFGINWDDVYIPDDIKAQIDGYGFAYAKRDTNDMTIYGNDYLQYLSKINGWSGDFRFDSGINNDYNNSFLSGTPRYTLEKDKVSSKCLDLLHSKLAISPSAIMLEYYMRIAFPATIDLNNNVQTLVDWTDTPIITKFSSPNNAALRKITEYQYLPNDIYVAALEIAHYSKQPIIYFKLPNTNTMLPATTAPYHNPLDATKIIYDNESTAYYSFLSLKSDIYQDYKELSNFIISDNIIDKDDTDSSGQIDSAIFFGDCYATLASHINHVYFENINFSNKDVVHALGSKIHYIIHNYPVLAANNWNLRHKTEDILTAYYPKYVNDITYFNNPGYYAWINAYNNDYTKLNEIIGTAYNRENIVQSRFPYRIAIGTSKGIDNDYSINWADFQANNFYELLDRNKGEIWKIIKYNEALLIYQKYCLTVATVKDKLITTTQEIYLGTGDIFDRKPNEVAFTNQGYVGNESQWAIEVCPLGVVSLDKNTGKIFIFNGTLDEVSSKGMRNYFRDNLQTSDINTDNPFFLNGLTLTYDRIYNRIIISKKNLVFSQEFTNLESNSNPDNETYVFYRGIYYIVKAGDKRFGEWDIQPAGLLAAGKHAEILDWEDSNLFTDTSKTISYSPVLNQNRGGWVAWHDYHPNHFFIDRNNNYVLRNNLDGSTVYNLLDTTKKGVYYDTTVYPSYFDLIFNQEAQISKVFNVIFWDTDVYALSDIYKKVNETLTFTHIMIYNNNQCSGLIRLDKSKGLLRNTKEKWAFNEFRDMVINSVNAFLDENKQLINTNIATKKAWFNENLFLSKFIVVRIYNDNVLPYEINVNSVYTNLKAIKNE